MQRLVLSTPDARRHVEEWTYREPDGKTATMTFELARADATPPAEAAPPAPPARCCAAPRAPRA
jgi:hypothetical protein